METGVLIILATVALAFLCTIIAAFMIDLDDEHEAELKPLDLKVRASSRRRNNH